MAEANCLKEAVSELRKSENLDETSKQRMVETFEDIIENKKLTEEQQLRRLAYANNAARKQAFIDQVSKRFDQAKQEELQTFLEQYPEEQRAGVLRNLIESEDSFVHAAKGKFMRGGDPGEVPQPGVDLSSRLSGVERDVMGSLNQVFKDLLARRPWVTDSEFAQTFHQELRGIDTGDPRAKADVQKFREVTEPLLNRLREAGVYVGELEDYAPQTHSASRIMQDEQAWREFLVENLDPEYHPDPEATADVAFRSLATRDLQDQDMATISTSRELRFKSPEAEYEYFNRYGDSGFAEALYHNVRSLARKTVLAENLGPTAQKNLEVLRKQEMENARIRGDQRAEAQARNIGPVAESLTGALENPANQNLAHWSGAARNWMVTQMLGQVSLLLGTQDSVISAMGARFHTGGFGSGVTEQIRNFQKVVGDDAARQYVEEMGYWTTALQMAATDRFSTAFGRSEATKGFAGQSATATQQLTGTYHLEKALRSASAMTVSRGLAKNSELPWEKLDKKYRRILEANGFTKSKWEQFRSASRTNDIGAIDLNSLPKDLREFALGFISRETDMMVVYPDHYSRQMLTAGAQAGTLAGEGAAAATQFLSWPIQFVRGPMRRELQMGGAGFVGFAASMMAAGAFSSQAYTMVKGEPTFEWDSTELWTRAVSRSGLLTPIGEMAMSQNRFGDFGLGPIPGVAADFTKLSWSAFDAAAGNASNEVAREAAQFAETVAVPNMFWLQYGVTRPAMDYAMWELDPEYMQDRQRRWREEGRNL